MTDMRLPSIERPYGWVVVITSLALMTIATGSQYVVVVGLKVIAAEFDWPRWVPSLAYSVSLLGMGAGGIAIGRWSDRSGIALPVLVGTFAVAGGAYLASISTGPILFIGAHAVLIGFVGTAATFSPLVASATRWFDRRRGVAVGIVISGQLLSGVLWPLLFRPLIENVGWRQTYVYFAIIALATMLPLRLLIRPKPPTAAAQAEEPADAKSPTGQSLGIPPGNLQTILCCAGVGCCISMSVPMVHVVAHGSDLGFSLTRATELLVTLLGCGFIGRLTWGAISDRIGGLMTLTSSSSLQLAALSTFLFVDTMPGLYAASALFGFAFAGIVPSYSIVVRELFSLDEVGHRIGVVYFFTFIGMALGGLIGGIAFDVTGSYTAAFAIGIISNLVNLSLVVPLLFRQKRLARIAVA